MSGDSSWAEAALARRGAELAGASLDDAARLKDLVLRGDGAYAEMYDARDPAGPYAEMKDCMSDAISLAERLGLGGLAADLRSELSRRKDIFRRQFP